MPKSYLSKGKYRARFQVTKRTPSTLLVPSPWETPNKTPLDPWHHNPKVPVRTFDVPCYPPCYWDVVAAFGVEAQWEEVKSLNCALGGATGPCFFASLCFPTAIDVYSCVFPAIHIYGLAWMHVNKASQSWSETSNRESKLTCLLIKLIYSGIATERETEYHT